MTEKVTFIMYAAQLCEKKSGPFSLMIMLLVCALQKCMVGNKLSQLNCKAVASRTKNLATSFLRKNNWAGVQDKKVKWLAAWGNEIG